MSLESARMWWCAPSQLWRAHPCDHHQRGCGWVLRTIVNAEQSARQMPSWWKRGSYKGRFMASKKDGGSFRGVRREG